MPDSSAKAVAELLMRDRYVDNELDAWRAAKWILGVAQDPAREVPPLRAPEASRPTASPRLNLHEAIAAALPAHRARTDHA